ncbi:thiol-disulfide isomerase/thioredoxin [Mucilaginibacter oryzae]|uniref:Thiol-disulfide isomerase/thioredoxin n=1 Tax=Mucilaginibacter oryzae TaxID=468058 RepID=A0A316H9B8_9SPHI|nr:TlpA disulfide reductase family protein [Mucilaginibacter oryzae]PWK77057.1 thiol-disulfide isomerase/thioredoxin [Mucilaginibacter oryzae]
MNRIIVLFFIGILTCSRLYAIEHKVSISGSVDGLKTGDSVTITVCPYLGRLGELKRAFTAEAKGSRFELQIPVSDTPRFVQIQFGRLDIKNVPALLLFPSDDLDFTIRDNRLFFRGPSASRFVVQQEIEALQEGYRRRFKTVYAPDVLPVSLARIDSGAAICLDYLESRKTEVGIPAYRVLKNNIMAGALASKYGYVTYTCLHQPADLQEKFIKAIRQLDKPFNGYPSFVVADSSGGPTSGFSVELVYQRYLVDSCILARRKFNLHDCYRFESRDFTGAMREQLVTELFMLKRNSPELAAADLEDALGFVKNTGFRAVLGKIRAMSLTGSVAPDFILRDAENKPVKLSDYRGKVVVLDFWFTGCGACKALAPVLFEVERKYEHRPVVFISISIDRTRGQWLATLKTNEYTSPLAVNFYTEGKGDRHEVIKDFDVHGYPTIIVIDREGRLCPKPELDERGLSALIDQYL